MKSTEPLKEVPLVAIVAIICVGAGAAVGFWFGKLSGGNKGAQLGGGYDPQPPETPNAWESERASLAENLGRLLNQLAKPIADEFSVPGDPLEIRSLDRCLVALLDARAEYERRQLGDLLRPRIRDLVSDLDGRDLEAGKRSMEALTDLLRAHLGNSVTPDPPS